MEWYETEAMPAGLAREFLAWFDWHIGTEREANELDNGLVYVTCGELETAEVNACREWEKRHNG